jgi:mRNA interferase MazF
MCEKFNHWNEIKKDIDFHFKNKKYHAGDIWWCKLGKNIGSEQNGSGKFFERPVLVIKGFNKEVCLVVPLTTKDKRNIFYFDIGLVGDKNNFAILSQLRLVDTKRFVNQIGFIDSSKLYKIKKAICNLIR